MKQINKKTILVFTTILLFGLILMACTDDDPSESEPMPSPEPTPMETAPPDEGDLSEDLDEPTAPSAQTAPSARTEIEADGMKAQMAGSWIPEQDIDNPYFSALINLFENGTWELPGASPDDVTIGGDFVIIREEAGIYYLRLTIEHVSEHLRSRVVEIGSEFGVYKYDARNDRLGMEIAAEGGAVHTVWFARE